MNKSELIAKIRAKLEEDLKALRAAALETYAAATGEESRPENEYDTRALEASYLAGAQGKRVSEIESNLTVLKFIEAKNFSDNTPIGNTALVSLDQDGKKLMVFLIPISGGVTVQFQSQTIQIISPHSPLGEALLGLKVGDFAVVDKGSQSLEYEILKVE